jgi:predicted transcriptional regulator
MELELTPELEAKLDRLSRETGRQTRELVETALTGYVDELLELRETLDRRYDDIKNGKVNLIPGHEVFRRLREKSAARRLHR